MSLNVHSCLKSNTYIYNLNNKKIDALMKKHEFPFYIRVKDKGGNN